MYVYERNRAQLSEHFALSFALHCKVHLPLSFFIDAGDKNEFIFFVNFFEIL